MKFKVFLWVLFAVSPLFSQHNGFSYSQDSPENVMAENGIGWELFAASSLRSLPNGFSFTLDAPESVVAGNDFEVTITFRKGELNDYSRFSQDLPAGFTARNIVTPNGDFTFTEQRVRIIWLKLPEEPEIIVRYAVDVHERLSGKLELSGTFAYVKDGDRAYLNLSDPVIVNILPNPNIDASLVVDISEFHTIKTSPNIVEQEEPVQDADGVLTVVRQKPKVEANGIVNVNLLLRKPEGAAFLKLEEMVPDGYQFEAIDEAGAVVTEAASLARFVWMKPPQEDVFMVKYRLVPIPGREQDPLVAEGTLSFSEDGVTRIKSVVETEADIAAMSSEQQAAFMTTGVIPDVKAERKLTDVEKKDPRPVDPVMSRETGRVKPAARTGAGEGAVQRRPVPGHEQYTRSTKSTIIDIEPLVRERGVVFRVQVAAVRYPYFPRVYFAYYDLLREVQVELLDGWNKYTVGSFSSYEEAAKHKNRIIAETPEHSSFIVAYRDGRRVPVADVL